MAENREFDDFLRIFGPRPGRTARKAAAGPEKSAEEAGKSRRGRKKGFPESEKIAKFLRKSAIFEENEKFFEKGVDICFSRGRLNAVRRERDNRKEVRGARADWF